LSLRNFRNTIPEIFLQHTSDLISSITSKRNHSWFRIRYWDTVLQLWLPSSYNSVSQMIRQSGNRSVRGSLNASSLYNR
jgi:hypothetical protein